MFFLTALAFVLVLGGYLYVYLGVSKPVTIQQAQRGPLYLLYKDHMGPYHKIGSVIDAAEAWAHAHGVACPRTFGEFLDDPQAVDEDRLRSHAGCLLDSKPAGSTDDFTFEERPAQRYVVGRFEGSPSIGPFKVYPKIRKYIETERLRTSGPNLEVYRVNGEAVETEYLFPHAAPVK
jgi:DNA gyrase inhibitor GyrI